MQPRCPSPDQWIKKTYEVAPSRGHGYHSRSNPQLRSGSGDHSSGQGAGSRLLRAQELWCPPGTLTLIPRIIFENVFFKSCMPSGTQPACNMKMRHQAHQGGSKWKPRQAITKMQKRFHTRDFSKITSSVLLSPKAEWNFCSFAMISLGWLCNKCFSSFIGQF